MMKSNLSSVPVDRKAINQLAAILIRQRIEWGFEREGNAYASESVRANQVDGKALAFSFPEKPFMSQGIGPRIL